MIKDKLIKSLAIVILITNTYMFSIANYAKENIIPNGNFIFEIKQLQTSVTTGKLNFPEKIKEKMLHLLNNINFAMNDEGYNKEKKIKGKGYLLIITNKENLQLQYEFMVNSFTAGTYVNIKIDKTKKEYFIKQKNDDLYKFIANIFENYTMKPVIRQNGYDIYIKPMEISNYKDIKYNLRTGKNKIPLELEIKDSSANKETHYEFFKNGMLKRVIYYVDGKRNGICRAYFYNGQIRALIPYVNNKISGRRFFFDEHGATNRK